ncbi:MAG: hypothetical protein ACRCZO_18645 [Cetobacterium sp.]
MKGIFWGFLKSPNRRGIIKNSILEIKLDVIDMKIGDLKVSLFEGL